MPGCRGRGEDESRSRHVLVDEKTVGCELHEPPADGTLADAGRSADDDEPRLRRAGPGGVEDGRDGWPRFGARFGIAASQARDITHAPPGFAGVCAGS